MHSVGSAAVPGRQEGAATHVLVRDDLHVLNMTSSLKDLAKNILCNTGVEPTDIERSLIRLGCHAAGEGTGAGGRHHAALVAGHGRGDGGRDGVRVLRNVQRRRRHVCRVGLAILAILEARSASIGLGRRRQLARGRGRSVLSHLVGRYDFVELRCGVEYVTRDYSFGRFSVAGNPTAQRAKQGWRVKVGGGGPMRIRSRKRCRDLKFAGVNNQADCSKPRFRFVR